MANFINDDKQFLTEFSVLSHDCDKQQNLKASSILKFFQNAADEHCSSFGCDFISLHNNGVAFVLVRTSVNVMKSPKLYDKIKILTWHKGAQGIQFFRDYQMTNEKNEVLVECGTSWVIVDPDTHKIKKPAEFQIPLKECPEISVPDVRLCKICMPELSYFGTKKVYYTEIDGNNHLTNWVYADIVENFVPNMNGLQVEKLDITFSSEAYEGDELKIFGKCENNTVFFRGEHERGKCFEAKIILVT